MKQINIISVLIWFTFYNANSQDFNVTGTVMTSDTKDTIENFCIIKDNDTLCFSHGTFNLHLEKPKQIMVFTYGYDPVKLTLVKDTTLQLYLNSEIQTLPAIKAIGFPTNPNEDVTGKPVIYIPRYLPK